MPKKEKVIFDRSPQLHTLKLDLDTSTVTALQTGCEVADVVLAMLTRADELCEMAQASGADMSKVADAVRP
jgi:hypothetical protein